MSGAPLESVLAEATSAASGLAATTPQQRAALLRRWADAIDAARDQLVPLAQRETHLPAARLTGEVARTSLQLRLLADLAQDGTCFDAVIEHADPEFVLGPRPDLRRVSEPLGPVLVFAASNFPFAFSVAGGDSASALAAGCPVVVKAHPGHPDLSDRVAALAHDCDLPLWAIHGVEAGTAALLDPRIKAAAFTGSTEGGRALFDLAAGRPEPIPFYGELGSVNPVFVSPGAAAARGGEIIDGFVASYTLGAGQFCTKPGLLLLPGGHALTDLAVKASAQVVEAPMLGTWVEERYLSLLSERRAHPEVATLYGGKGTAPTLLAAPIAALGDGLAQECFGPTSLVVDYESDAELLAFAASLEGALTATIHAEPDETAWVSALIEVLRQRVGRIIFNGWPTGVAVSPAMHHGGPWPATTAPLHSSVGGNAINRFLRPVCYQDVPDPLLPPALQEENPLGIRRRTDGVIQ